MDAPDLSRWRWVTLHEARVRSRLARHPQIYADNADQFLAKKLWVSEEEAVDRERSLACSSASSRRTTSISRPRSHADLRVDTIISGAAPNVPQCAIAFEKLFLDAALQREHLDQRLYQ